MKILVSGFTPFAGDDTNPSAELLQWLPTRPLPFELVTVLLPVSFTQAFPTLKRAIEAEKPDAVLSLGLAKNRPQLTLERVGLNWVDARIPDNDGLSLQAQKILPAGADALFTRLPLVEILQDCQRQGVELKISTSAGEYVCNHLLYLLLHEYPTLPAGFLHLPVAPDYTAVEKILFSCYHRLIMNQ